MLPGFEDGLYKFATLGHPAARKAVALKDAGGASVTDSKKIASKLSLSRGHASSLGANFG